MTIGDGAALDADSFLMKGAEVPPQARWRGNPARELRQAPPRAGRLPAAAAQALELRYDLGAVVAPVGWVLVKAAVDWRRMGTPRPIPEAELRQLCRRYLQAMYVDPPTDERSYLEGLAWACQPVAPQTALLQPAGQQPSRSFVPSEHIVAVAGRKDGGVAPGVANAASRLAVAGATPQEAVDLGARLAMRGDVEGARVAFERAADSRDPDHAPWAVIGLGLLLQLLGDPAHARLAYRHALESGHPQAAPVVARNLEALGEDP